jgi:hypothetical protein
MGLRYGMLICLIARRAVDWSKRPLTSNAAFKLSLYLLCAALLQRIGATAANEHRSDREKNREASHLFILRGK